MTERHGTKPTQREIELLKHIAEGERQDNIAQQMHVSYGWVRMTLYRLHQKMGAENSPNLIAIAFRRGIIK